MALKTIIISIIITIIITYFLFRILGLIVKSLTSSSQENSGMGFLKRLLSGCKRKTFDKIRDYLKDC